MNTTLSPMEIKINPEFEKLIPPLDEKELFMLKQSLWKEGCRDALVIWRGMILDGHHRYKYCKEKGLPFKVIERDFSTEDDAFVWMINNQMGRRNIETAAKIRLALKKEGILSKEAKKRSGFRSDLKGKVVEGIPLNNLPQDLAEGYGEVRDLIGEECGVSGFTVDKFKYIEEKAPHIADDLCAGKKINNKKLSIDGVYRDLKKEERQETLKSTEFPSGKYRVIYADPRND